MTLDAAACAGSGYGWYQDWVEGSLQLTSSSGFGTWCAGNGNFGGSPALFLDGYGALATLSAVGGGTFTLSSIELAPALYGGKGGTVEFNGTVDGGGLIGVAFEFPTAVMMPAFTPFSFGPAWTNLTQVTWRQASGDAPSFHQFDNINGGAEGFGTRMIELFVEEELPGPTETVPEPATMTLLATGLIGMSLARRRRRN